MLIFWELERFLDDNGFKLGGVSNVMVNHANYDISISYFLCAHLAL